MAIKLFPCSWDVAKVTKHQIGFTYYSPWWLLQHLADSDVNKATTPKAKATTSTAKAKATTLKAK